MGLTAVEILDLMEEILNGDDEFIEENDLFDYDEAKIKAHKAVKGGKVVKIAGHTKQKMSSKQKMSLAKARKLAWTGTAKSKRLKSIKKSRDLGLS
jgi:hypothetical protein